MRTSTIPHTPRQLTFTLPERNYAQAVEVRRHVHDLAVSVGLGERALDIAVAVTELVTNALEHGEPPVEVQVRWNGRLTVDVVDHGRGTDDPSEWGRVPPHDGAERGRGVWIVRQMMDSFEVHREPDGTHVRVTLTQDPSGEGVV